MKNEGYVRTPMAVVLQMSRVMGIAPLNIEPVRNGYKITISQKWAVYGYILITILNIIILMGLFEDFERRAVKTKSLTVFMFAIVNIITTMLSTGLGAYNGINRMENLIKYLTLLDKVKTDMNKSDKKLSREKMKLTMGIVYLLLLFAFYATHTYLNFVDYPTEKFIVSAYGIFYIEDIIVVILQLQMIFILLETHSVLKLMSDKLNRMLTLDRSEHESINQEINFIGCAYITICEVISNINDLDGCITLLSFVNFISSIVTNVYYGNIFFTVLTAHFVFIQLSWCCLYAIRVLVIIETFHLINREVDFIKVITSKLILKVTDLGKCCPINVEIIFKQLLLNEPAYSPMGLFTLNRSLINTIFSVAITCLLFFIQFK